MSPRDDLHAAVVVPGVKQWNPGGDDEGVLEILEYVAVVLVER